MCEKVQKKCQSKTCFNDPIKKCTKLKAKLLTATYKSKVVCFKLDKDSIHRQVYLLSFINSLRISSSPFSETYMLIMDYPSMKIKETLDYDKRATRKKLHTYIDTHSQIIIDYLSIRLSTRCLKISIPMCKHDLFWPNYI